MSAAGSIRQNGNRPGERGAGVIVDHDEAGAGAGIDGVGDEGISDGDAVAENDAGVIRAGIIGDGAGAKTELLFT